MVKMILFDLDGTLLPMDQEIFIKAYFGGIAKKAAPLGYVPEDLIRAIWSGTMQMIKNDGNATNEEVFWRFFAQKYGEAALADQAVFDAFYRNEFELVRSVCGFHPAVRSVIDRIKGLGYRIALATNPIFPCIATEARTRWAGLSVEDFELYTTYENSRYCKPNTAYYMDIVRALGVAPEECLMVGNDVEEDMVAEQLGMRVFLLTDCLINKNNKDISVYPNGSFPELLDFIESL